MKEDEQYEGIRLKLICKLASARIPIQVDIGFGDAISPSPNEIVYPALLDFPSPTLQTYPKETVIAEKFQAMVMLGIANSRMKDFFDIWSLASGFTFSGAVLSTAIEATFDRRQTQLPTKPPLALTPEFTRDTQKLAQWTGFLRKGKLTTSVLGLSEIGDFLCAFLMPPTVAIAEGEKFRQMWFPEFGWKSE